MKQRREIKLPTVVDMCSQVMFIVKLFLNC